MDVVLPHVSSSPTCLPKAFQILTCAESHIQGPGSRRLLPWKMRTVVAAGFYWSFKESVCVGSRVQ